MKITTGLGTVSEVGVKLSLGSAVKFVEKDGVPMFDIGYGNEKTLSRRKAILFARKIVACAKGHRIASLELAWRDIRVIVDKEISDAQLGELLATAFLMADFEFVALKTPPKEGFPFINEITITGTTAAAKRGIERGVVVGEEVNACRTLANSPGGNMTPIKLAQAAQMALKGTKATFKALDKEAMEELKMGAILGVAQGSTEEPRFIVLEYWGAGKDAKKKPVVLVGKGVTFDSGGLNIKPGDSMYEMHMDMSGGAAVIHAVALAAKLGVKRNVIGLIPAVENMPSGSSYRPGDVLVSMSGKTIEVLNTDAEGRIILADAITYSRKYNPSIVVEASTLTGAVLIALGQQASAVLSRDEKLVDNLRELGEESGDYVWPLPLWEEYEPMVKGNFGDISNIPANGNSRYGGVIGGGMFLQQFAEGLRFAHLDIASRMTSAPGEHLAKGAAGAPVRLFLAICENL